MGDRASLIAGYVVAVRRPCTAGAALSLAADSPNRPMLSVSTAQLFCRNLGVLLGSGVNLTAALRILVDIMAATGTSRGVD